MAKHSDETKAAVMAALLAGQSVSSTAKEYKLPKGTVSNWKRKAKERAGGTEETYPKKAAEIGELLIGYLHTNLETLRVQSVFFRNEAWLKQQNAADLAVLHGVVTDKSIRLLESLSGTSAES